MRNSGAVSKPTDLKPSERSLPDSSTDILRVWVAAELQTVRELVPGPAMSDHATNIMLDALEAMAREIGTVKFHGVILQAINTCERRPTVATYRKLAGLNTRLGPQEEALAKGWELVSLVVTRFISRDAHGNVVVQPRINQRNGEYYEEMPPALPESVERAVYAMGGWKALASAFPDDWARRFLMFKDLFSATPEDQALLLAPTSKALAVTK